jgi:hypothetical protein
MEYATSNEVFLENGGRRIFRYVQIVGLVWQFMFSAKQLFARYNYSAGARILVNLVGTRETVLEEFSKEPGEGKRNWSEPFLGDFFSPAGSAPICADPNLQMEYRFICASLDEKQSHEIADGVARQLGLAYNHKSGPRCFNYHTKVFPWQQYLNGRLN